MVRLFGLPKSTELNKQLPKKVIFEKFKPNVVDRKLFDDQISRLSIVAEISPQTISIAASEDVSTVYIVLVTLKVPDCDKKNIILLSKLIDQRMLFALQYEDTIRFAAYRSARVLISKIKQIDDWRFNLSGLNIGVIWDNITAVIAGIEITNSKGFDETIFKNEYMEKLAKQIAIYEKKAISEKQPRRKWELVEEIIRLKEQLRGELQDEQL